MLQVEDEEDEEVQKVEEVDELVITKRTRLRGSSKNSTETDPTAPSTAKVLLLFTRKCLLLLGLAYVLLL